MIDAPPTPTPPRRLRRPFAVLAAASALLALGGCAAFHLGGAMAQAFEDQKLIEVDAEYHGLENKRVAVLVDAGLDLLYEHPDLVQAVASGMSSRLLANVPGIEVVDPAAIVRWQWNTPQWNAMPWGEVANELDADRVVVVDIHDYRLNPPGNRYLWEGVCAATVGVIERDGFDPDTFVQAWDVRAEFPTQTGLDRASVAEQTIVFGLRLDFMQKSTRIFHRHIRPKHPDRYRPELDA